MSGAAGVTSSLPLGEKIARNTFTLLRLLLNYTINICRRMYWARSRSSNESRWIWMARQYPRQLPLLGPRNSLLMGRADNFLGRTVPAVRHGVSAGRSSVRCDRCCIAGARGDRPAHVKTQARRESAATAQAPHGPVHLIRKLTRGPHRGRLPLQQN